jgi:hypothetical protein
MTPVPAHRTPPAPRRSTGTPTTTPKTATGSGRCRPNRTAARRLPTAEFPVGLTMVASAQRHQIAQGMGICLVRVPGHYVMHMQHRTSPGRPALHATPTITSQRPSSLTQPPMRTPAVRVRPVSPRWRRRTLGVLALPHPIARHPTERTPLPRRLSLIRLPLERLEALHARQRHPRRLRQIPTPTRAIHRLPILPPVASLERLPTLLTFHDPNGHVLAPSLSR